MFIVPWYGFPWWLSLGLIPWRFPFPVASVVGLCGFLFCRCCVSRVFGRLVVGRACPCPPLLVGLLLCLVLLVVLVCLVFFAAALSSGPPSP